MPKRTSGCSREGPEAAPEGRGRKKGAARKQPQTARRDAKVAVRKRRAGATASRRKRAPSARPAPPRPELDARLAFFDRARRHAPYLGIEVDGARFVVSTDDAGLGRGMFGKRGRPEFKALARAVTVIHVLAGEEAVAGRLFVDVGANIGTTTVAALVSHGFGAAVCLEPEAENYRLLRANLALNGLDDRVRSARVGVSNRAGRSLLVVVGQGGGSQNWIAEQLDMVRRAERNQAALAAENPELQVAKIVPVEVELVTLDGLVESGVIDKQRVGMVWVDAEGHEGHILQGGAGLLDDGVPVVLEFHPAGLDERGDRDQIHAIAEDAYTHFVDVRRREAGRPRFQLQPVRQLTAYADRLLAATGEGFFTDVLLLRLNKSQVRKGSQLPSLVAARLDAGGQTT
jgi:FkbM family methyltransferase